MSDHCKELWSAFKRFGGTFECTTGKWGDGCRFWKLNESTYECEPSKDFVEMVKRSSYRKAHTNLYPGEEIVTLYNKN